MFLNCPPNYPLAGPESEELAALYDRFLFISPSSSFIFLHSPSSSFIRYDRFLLRRRVSPVSADGVLELLLGVAGRTESGADEPPDLERTGLPYLEPTELTLRQVLEHFPRWTLIDANCH